MLELVLLGHESKVVIVNQQKYRPTTVNDRCGSIRGRGAIVKVTGTPKSKVSRSRAIHGRYTEMKTKSRAKSSMNGDMKVRKEQGGKRMNKEYTSAEDHIYNDFWQRTVAKLLRRSSVIMNLFRLCSVRTPNAHGNSQACGEGVVQWFQEGRE